MSVYRIVSLELNGDVQTVAGESCYLIYFGKIHHIYIYMVMTLFFYSQSSQVPNSDFPEGKYPAPGPRLLR